MKQNWENVPEWLRTWGTAVVWRNLTLWALGACVVLVGIIGWRWQAQLDAAQGLAAIVQEATNKVSQVDRNLRNVLDRSGIVAETQIQLIAETKLRQFQILHKATRSYPSGETLSQLQSLRAELELKLGPFREMLTIAEQGGSDPNSTGRRMERIISAAASNCVDATAVQIEPLSIALKSNLEQTLERLEFQIRAAALLRTDRPELDDFASGVQDLGQKVKNKVLFRAIQLPDPLSVAADRRGWLSKVQPRGAMEEFRLAELRISTNMPSFLFQAFSGTNATSSLGNVVGELFAKLDNLENQVQKAEYDPEIGWLKDRIQLWRYFLFFNDIYERRQETNGVWAAFRLFPNVTKGRFDTIQTSPFHPWGAYGEKAFLPPPGQLLVRAEREFASAVEAVFPLKQEEKPGSLSIAPIVNVIFSIKSHPDGNHDKSFSEAKDRVSAGCKILREWEAAEKWRFGSAREIISRSAFLRILKAETNVATGLDLEQLIAKEMKLP